MTLSNGWMIYSVCVFNLDAFASGLGWVGLVCLSIFSFTQGGSYFGFGRVLIDIANACMGFDRTGIQRFFLIIAHSVCWSIPDGLESE
jgi:hypothetical protein